MLRERELEFEVVTPVYLGGPEPRQRAQSSAGGSLPREGSAKRVKSETRIRLRPVLAMWRFWHRARLGAATASMSSISEAERALFGGGGADASAAALRMRLIDQKIELADFTERRGHKSYATYLGYGLAERRQRGTVVEHPRWGIEPGSTFRLGVTTSDSNWAKLKPVIETWVHCGGLGARHRRGLGSIRWNDPSCRTPESFFEALPEVAPAIEQPREPAFEILHPDWCKVRLFRGFSTWQEALTAIRNQLRIDAGDPGDPRNPERAELNKKGTHPISLKDPLSRPSPTLGPLSGARQLWGFTDYRLSGRRGDARYTYAYYRGIDHDVAEQAKRGTGSPPLHFENIIFGLPVPYATWKLTVGLQINGKEGRRPSPLCFRVFRDGDQFGVLALLFRSAFLPPYGRPRITANGMPVAVPPWTNLEIFFRSFGGALIFG